MTDVAILTLKKEANLGLILPSILTARRLKPYILGQKDWNNLLIRFHAHSRTLGII